MTKLKLSQIKEVLICEDHSFIQLGIEIALKEILPEACSYAVAKCGAEAIALADSTQFHLAFVDLGLPDMSGTVVVEKLKEISPKTRIMVVTSCDNPLTLRQVEKLAPSAIIQKSSSSEHLKLAILQLEDRHSTTYLDEETRSLLGECEEIHFTAKENEVLSEIVQGLSNQEIAQRMGCSLTTIRFHRANILSKTGMKNAAELTAWYLQGQRKRN